MPENSKSISCIKMTNYLRHFFRHFYSFTVNLWLKWPSSGIKEHSIFIWSHVLKILKKPEILYTFFIIQGIEIPKLKKSHITNPDPQEFSASKSLITIYGISWDFVFGIFGKILILGFFGALFSRFFSDYPYFRDFLKISLFPGFSRIFFEIFWEYPHFWDFLGISLF